VATIFEIGVFLFLAIFGVLGSVTCVFGLLRFDAHAPFKSAAIVGLGGTASVLYLWAATAVIRAVVRSLCGVPPEPPRALDASHGLGALAGVLIRIAVTGWGTLLGIGILITCNFGWLDWWERVLGPPPIITQVFAGLLGAFFVVSGAAALVVDCTWLLRKIVPARGKAGVSRASGAAK